ncbi:MAG: hypothetical protein HY314_06965 [Acidobacteria bacterium]|nr:hypothetical protein [Acidobacteriota bacterium]
MLGRTLINNQSAWGTPCDVLGDLKAEWLGLFERAKRTGQIGYQVAEPGYHLIAIPQAALAQGLSLESAFHLSLAHLPELAAGRLVRLEMLDEYELQIRDSYRVWAAPFAPEIDAGHLHAGAYVDLRLFQHRLWDCLTEHHLGYEEPESGIIIIRGPFRHWVNLCQRK